MNMASSVLLGSLIALFNLPSQLLASRDGMLAAIFADPENEGIGYQYSDEIESQGMGKHAELIRILHRMRVEKLTNQERIEYSLRVDELRRAVFEPFRTAGFSSPSWQLGFAKNAHIDIDDLLNAKKGGTALQNNYFLLGLIVEGNITSEKISALADLSYMRGVAALFFKNPDFTLESMRAFANSINLEQLLVLNVTYDLGTQAKRPADREFLELVNSRMIKRLRNLHLKCDVTDDGLAALLKLKDLDLKSIELPAAFITDRGAIDLVGSQLFAQLKALSLYGNQIELSGAQALVSAAAKTGMELNIDQNPGAPVNPERLRRYKLDGNGACESVAPPEVLSLLRFPF